MRERLLDIVTLLARYLFEERHPLDDQEAITEELVADGYDPQDIREAFEWLELAPVAREGGAAAAGFAAPDLSTRVLTPAETLKITPPACGFLVRLRQLGLIDASMQERVLERAMGIDADEIGIDEIKAITAFFLFNKSPFDVQDHLLDILDDRRDRLYH